MTAAPPPTDLPTLVRLACDDYHDLDRDLYEPWYGVWHAPAARADAETDRCEVCLAGAVVAGTLQLAPDTSLDDEDVRLSDDWWSALGALECVRRGHWYTLARDGWLTKAEADHLSGLIVGVPDKAWFRGWKAADMHVAWARRLADTLAEMRDA